MAKKKKQQNTHMNRASQENKQEKPVTLKDMLSADLVNKLKAQSDELKQAEADRLETARRAEEEKRKAEQKARENDFAYLLENSDPSWGKYKA